MLCILNLIIQLLHKVYFYINNYSSIFLFRFHKAQKCGFDCVLLFRLYQGVQLPIIIIVVLFYFIKVITGRLQVSILFPSFFFVML